MVVILIIIKEVAVLAVVIIQILIKSDENKGTIIAIKTMVTITAIMSSNIHWYQQAQALMEPILLNPIIDAI
jgi:hypothetical protein